jgi:hypothetical protein
LDELQRTRDSFVNLLESLRAGAKIAEGTFTRGELIAIAEKDIAAIDAILAAADPRAELRSSLGA